MDKQTIQGADVLLSLARRFPQLYVAPAEDAEEANRLAASRGIAPKGANLEHFIDNASDELRVVETPAGPVEVISLQNRADFETLLQIISHRSTLAPIAKTVGAITYRNLPDWAKVSAAHAEYKAQVGDDWKSEFARLAKVPGAFRSEIIVISNGPYSNLPASETPYGESEWIGISREIRLYHECGHVVCRRTMPEDILPVWDEVTADVTGLLFATGGYDAQLAAKFLGVNAHGWSEGRLIEYLNDEQKEQVDAIAREVWEAMEAVEKLVNSEAIRSPFDFLLQLKREPLLRY